MQFHDFPTDILALLLNGQNSWSAIELYKCGNRSLNNKIVKSVTHIDLKDTEPLSTSRWPRCLKEFKLESLSIFRNGGTLGTTEMVRGELKKLSSTLKDIEIHAVNIGMCFFDETTVGTPNHGEGSISSHDPGDDSSDDEDAESGTGARKDHEQAEDDKNIDEEENDDDGEPRPSKRSKTTEANDQNAPHTSMWNLEFTWPHLERLELTDRGHSADQSFEHPTGCFGSSVFAMLPRSLTWFAFEYAFTYECLVDLSALPPRLETLRIPGGSVDVPGLRTLPKSITDLGDSVEAETVLPLLLKKPSLLPNLKDLPYHWDPQLIGGEWLQEIYFGIRSWSRDKHILKVGLSNVSEDIMFQNLPPNLTSLACYGGDIDVSLAAEHLVGLPRHMTSIRLQHMNWHRNIDVTHWPPTLTKLDVSSDDFGVHCFQYLPRGLKDLAVGAGGGFSGPLDDNLVRLCNDADALRTIGKDSLLLDDAIWQVEKPRLLAAGSQAYVEAIEAGGLYGLPLLLTRMNLGSVLYPITQRLLMPPRLREVESLTLEFKADDPTLFDAFKYIGPVSLTVRLLPPTPSTLPTSSDASEKLTSLFLSNISSLVVYFLGTEAGLMRYLPRGLRHLTFNGKLHPDEFDHLPPNLETLSLYHSIEGLLPSHLPRTIKALTLNDLAGSDLKDLPPHLETLAVRSIRDVQLSHLLELPRSLRSLILKPLPTRALSGPKKQDIAGVLSDGALETLINTYRPFWRIWHTGEAQITKEITMATEIGQGGTSGTTRDDIDPRTVRRLQPHGTI